MGLGERGSRGRGGFVGSVVAVLYTGVYIICIQGDQIVGQGLPPPYVLY